MNSELQGGTTLISEFEKQVESHPLRVAIEHSGTQLTYSQLHTRVVEIAACLVDLSVEPSDYVGLYLTRSPDLIAALLAILKVGAAYVPMDTSTPLQRVMFVLSDAKLRLVITDLEGLKQKPFVQIRDLKNPGSVFFPTVKTDADAYVIYTSGSTGQPKGVICTQRNVLRLFAATQEQFNFSANDRWTLFHSVAFDFSVWEIFGALLYGATLIIVPSNVARDTFRFSNFLMDRRVTILSHTPSAFYNLLVLAESRNIDFFSQLRVIVFGGERLEVTKLRRWFESHASSRPKLINMYGITETTVHVTYREITEEDSLSSSNLSPIGRPIGDLTVYLLNDKLEQVAPGEVGEMCVGGAGVSRGYLNRPELTAQRFVRNPFASQCTDRLYRSGDFGQQAHNGEIYYLGRADRQVKIRGYRIELAEIEAALLNVPGVSVAHASAVDFGNDDKRLIGYFIPGEMLPTAEITERIHRSLEALLPSYMIPMQLHGLVELPLTVNGKVDERQLAALALNNDAGTSSGLLTDPIERKVHEICVENLKLPHLDTTVGLAEAGAHSLAIVIIAIRLQDVFGIQITPPELAAATIISIAQNIRAAQSSKSGDLEGHK